MTTIVTRAGKGSPLTNNEVDANFTNLNTYKVEVTGTPLDGQVITWDSATSTWIADTPAGGGTVTSVAASGGTTGLTFSGSPITSTGTLTLGGTLAVASGGTGGTTASTARANLSAAVSGANNDITSLSAITGGIGSPDYIQFDTVAVTTPAVGQLNWNDTDGTLEFGMKGGNVVLQVGQEQVVRVTNATASGMVSGQAVYITGSTGNHLNVELAKADAELTSSKTLAVITESISASQSGFATTSGLVRGLDTSALTEGAAIWLSASVAGGLTSTRPIAPNNAVLIGWCVRQHASVGVIYVHIANGYELDELHDVKITGTPAAGSLIIRNATDKLWENATLTAGTGISVTNADKSITVTNSAPDQVVALTGSGTTSVSGTYPNFTITSNDNFTGTVTSVAVSGGTTGLTFSGSPITTSGTVTLGGTLGIGSGGTGQTTASAAFDALSPNTTLGDITYRNSTGNTRLAGNTTATKQFLSQTGTGTVSAAPVWSAVSKSDVGLANVENTAVSTWAGSTNITTLGTIATGVWNGSTIPVANGGTGATSLTSGYLLKGNGTSAVSTSVVYESGGNVGIGTTSPNTKLDVVGNVIIGAALTTGTGASTGDVLVELGANRTGDGPCYIDWHSTAGTDFECRVLRNSGANGTMDIQNTGTGGINLSNLGSAPITLNTAGAERMRIDSSGNVGIGTTSLTQKFTLQGNQLIIPTSGWSVGQTAFSYLGDTNNGLKALNGGDLEAFSFNGFKITVNGATPITPVYVTATGRVGIGTSNPGSELEVADNENNNDARITVRPNSTTTSQFGGSSTITLIDSSGARSIVFYTNGTDRFLIDGSSGVLNSLPTYNNTATGSTVVVTSTGAIRRTSSSVKYKKDIENLDPALVTNAVDNLRPVYYRTKNAEGDDKASWSHIGLIAEEVHEVEPRLVRYRTAEVETDEEGNRVERELEVPEPEDVDYARLSVLLLAEIKQLRARMAALEAK